MNLLPKLRTLSISAAPIWLLMAVCAVLISAIFQWQPPSVGVYPGDEWLRDRFVSWHASDEPETRLTLVDIDEASLVKIGPWPWPRERIAELIEKLLSDYGARAVALDLYFPESADAEGDMRLALLAQHGPVVLAQAFDYGNAPLRNGNLITGQAVNVKTSPASGQASPAASGYMGNHAGLAAAQFAGNIGFVHDADGVLRHIPPLTQFEGMLYPTLSKAIFDCCAAKNPTSLPGSATLKASPLNKDGYIRIPYSRSMAAYTVIKAARILDQTAPAEFLQGTLVLVGSSSLSLSDRVTTPFGPNTSGFLVHAQALSTLLDGQVGLLPKALPGRWLALLFSLLVAGLAVYTFPRLSALSNALILGGASIAWLGIAYALSPHDPFFSPSGPVLSNLFLLAFAVPFGWQVSQGKSRRLLGTLQQYVARAVVDELLRSDLKDPLAPRQSHVTTLIADMEAYTTHVESLPVADAAKLTRDFLECLTGPVLDKGGTLDKYTGDGLVAFWGAPLPITDHADLALDAAIAIVDNVRKLNADQHRQGSARLRVRIGIESGIAMAGDFGTSSRSIYTAVGDSVNVASRLEDIARDLPHDIIIGQGTVDNARRHTFQLLGDRMLRGKENPTTLFTVEIPG
ncbi:CHASE2 domain-containing protein [Undibacterium sp. TJN25]|uniref:CHASE2 domain-containing protein n=1 Tax=Undibacterium sp. TJN25 TaxID=3413056 RepID=UPI003BEFBA97